ncbi:hypothetical protein BaRGS_00012377 [Batillaria attramentaria]|uniref:Uncharacterized protein n=1 Tax=Batillaria attramentaria TaxID=370345 RepID=A0ABD0LAS5_9CAEN
MALNAGLRVAFGFCLVFLLFGNSGIAQASAAAGDGRAANRGEVEEPTLSERSAQIIREQDAEEGQAGLATVKLAATGYSDTLCLKPRAPTNGYIEGSNFEDGGKVHVRCNKTYHLIGPSELTCIPVPDPAAKHGVWLPQDTYMCKRNNNNSLCLIPKPPANGYITGDSFEDGDKVNILCNEGYRLNGPSQIMCVPVSEPQAKHGVWIPQTTYTCIRNARSGTAASDWRQKTETTLEHHDVHVQVDTPRGSYHSVRYGVSQDSNIVSAPGGETTVCSMPPPPTNGYIEAGDADLVLGGKAKVVCEVGYTLIGPDELTCHAVPYPGVQHGWWQPTDPYSCLPANIVGESADEAEREPSSADVDEHLQLGDNSFCGEPHPPENGYIEGHNFDYGGKVHVRCEEGYTLIGPSELTCEAVPCRMCGHGAWAPRDEYSCTRSDSDFETNMVDIRPLNMDKGTKLGPSYAVLTRPRERTMEGDYDVKCPTPTPPAHGDFDGTDYSLYSRLNIECDPGYTLNGLSYITCLPVPDPFRRAGIWEPQDMATCEANPPSILPLNLVENSVKVHQRIGNRLSDSVPSSNRIEGLPSACGLPKVVGPCKAAFPRFYFDRHQMECLPFTYGGCQGNDNNFETFEACQHACR